MIAILEDKKSFRKTMDLPYMRPLVRVFDKSGINFCEECEMCEKEIPQIDFRFSHWLEPNEVAIYKEVE